MLKKPGNEKLPDVVKPALDPLKILKGQKALVTGANSGIGKAIALALGHAGADVAVNYVGHEADAIAVCNEIKKCGSQAIAIQADVSKEDQVIAMYQQMYQSVRHDRHPRQQRRRPERFPAGGDDP